MSTTSMLDVNRGGAAVQPVGELLYRFEADLDLTPIGLVTEAIAVTVEYDGRIAGGMLAGERAWRSDPPPLRVDGVGIVDTAKTSSESETTLLGGV